jgi:hypothetical protein
MSSTLNPTNAVPPREPRARKGNDTRTLGPSDSSDSGSDLAGPGLIEGDLLGLDRGTNEDSESGPLDARDAGTSIGDSGMNEDSDRYGTGVRTSAGRESSAHVAADIDFDRIVGADDAGLGGGLDQAEEARGKAGPGGRAPRGQRRSR